MRAVCSNLPPPSGSTRIKSSLEVPRGLREDAAENRASRAHHPLGWGGGAQSRDYGARGGQPADRPALAQSIPAIRRAGADEGRATAGAQEGRGPGGNPASGIPGVACPSLRELRRETVALVQARLEKAGIGFLDLDQALARTWARASPSATCSASAPGSGVASVILAVTRSSPTCWPI
jgi:hypothetical protein